MKYREIYAALERRWRVSPGFRFTDLSGWRNPRSSDARCRPLWIIVEDKVSKRRVWITQMGQNMKITYMKMDDRGECRGESHVIQCTDRKHMAREMEKLFAKPSKAA